MNFHANLRFDAKVSWMTRWTIAAVSVAGICFVVSSSPNIAHAQGLFDSRMQMGAAEFLPPPRSMRQIIRDAEEAIEQERYSDAVVRLGDLLLRSDDNPYSEILQDYYFPIADADDESEDDVQPGQPLENQEGMLDRNGRRIGEDEDQAEALARLQSRLPRSLMEYVRDVIGELPGEGLEIYELRYGPLAGKLLDEAGPARDWKTVERVRRETFHTEAGYKASVLLAVREWTLGNPLACSFLLDDLVSQQRIVDQVGESVVTLHAIACARADRMIPTPLEFPKSFTSLFPKVEDADEVAWKEWVRAQSESDLVTAESLAENYPILGGRADRNGSDSGQMPLSNPRWMVESSASPRQERMIQEKTQQLKATGQLPPPSWTPLRVGDQLLMRTTQRLLGVDFRTGKRVWQYPWFAPAETSLSTELADPMEEEEDPVDILVQRVWNDVPFGQISSDGERVFMIDNLGKIEIERFSPFASRGMSSLANTLVALGLGNEGKILWRLGKSETTPSVLSEAFFLGPPLPFRGDLYVMAEIAGEVVLLCLDPADGSVQWQQVLVAVESGGIGADPVRRVAGAMPTYHNGLLICPTGAGATVAVNLIDRTIRWGNQIPRSQEFVHSIYRPNTRVSANQLSRRWTHSLAIAKGTSVVLTPIECDRLQVLDVLSGRNRFTPKNRIRLAYVAGVKDDLYFVVGADEVSACSLNDGSEVWSTPTNLVRPGQRISGRGVFGNDRYYLPTTTDELIEISLKNGEVLQRRTVRFPLGNLIAVDGELISQSATMVAVAYGERSLQPRVDALLQKDPENFFALVRKAELLIEQEERPQALKLLRKARELDPDNDEVIMLSVEAMLGSLRQNPSDSNVDLEALMKLIDQPEQRAELLVLQIKGAIERSPESIDHPKALELLLDLSQLVLQHPTLNRDMDAVFPNAARQFTVDDWISARVARLVSTASEDELTGMTGKIESLVSSRGNMDGAALMRTLQHFSPVVGATSGLRRDMAARALLMEDGLLAERLIWAETLATDESLQSLSNERLLMLAKLYSKEAWNLDRLAIGELLSQRLSDNEPVGADTFIEDALQANPIRGRDYDMGEQWPRNVNLEWQSMRMPRSSGMMMNDRRYAKTTHLMGRQLRGWSAMSDNMNSLALMNPYGIHRSIPIEGFSGMRSLGNELTYSGGLMLLLTQSELIAIDLFRTLGANGEEAIRWRRTLGTDGQPVAKRRSAATPFGNQIYRNMMVSATADNGEAQLILGPVLGDRLFLLQGTELICLDAVSGEERWRTPTEAVGNAVVHANGRVLVVSKTQNQIESYDIHDGGLLGIQKRSIGSVIASLGSHVLTVTQVRKNAELPADATEEMRAGFEAAKEMHDPHSVELIDMSTGETVLFRVADSQNVNDASAYAEVTDGRYFTLLDHTGRTTIWDLLSGREIADVMVPARQGLYGVSVMSIQDQMLVLPRHRKPNRDLASLRSVAVSGGASVQPITAMHSISTVDGSIRWSRSFDDAWGCTVEQPWVTPMLLLVRAHLTVPGNGVRRRQMDVMGISTVDGETLHEIERKETNSNTNVIESRVKLIPHRNTMLAEIQLELLTYTFKEEGSDDDVDSEADPKTDEADELERTKEMEPE
ncbi:oxidoreductase [Rhodopirellula bahusiensis]|uniref:Oxidoreductase n=2 Tax=Rhodopirellula bahusiensis TaxID=2014065 RepID=A0A2G1W8N5_9BACT|nr:oxidoreductase [Rhodopirellula bahusiensis]